MKYRNNLELKTVSNVGVSSLKEDRYTLKGLSSLIKLKAYTQVKPLVLDWRGSSSRHLSWLTNWRGRGTCECSNLFNVPISFSSVCTCKYLTFSRWGWKAFHSPFKWTIPWTATAKSVAFTGMNKAENHVNLEDAVVLIRVEPLLI